MIAHEHIRPIKIKDFFFVGMIVIITSLFLFVGNFIFPPTHSFIISLFFIVCGMNLTVYLTKKTGIAALFYVLTAIFTFPLNDLGVVGGGKLLTLFFAAFVFEIIFLFLKFHFHSIPLDMIIGTSLSIASIPLISAFSLSLELASSFPTALLNFILLAFSVGLGSSVIMFVIWHYIEKTKFIIKLESWLMSLGR